MNQSIDLIGMLLVFGFGMVAGIAVFIFGAMFWKEQSK